MPARVEELFGGVERGRARVLLPQPLALGGVGGDDGWGEDPPAQWGLVGTEGDLRKIRTEPGRYQAFYARLVAALKDGAPLPVDPAESVAVLEILEAARRSASGREIVQVAPTSAI